MDGPSDGPSAAFASRHPSSKGLRSLVIGVALLVVHSDAAVSCGRSWQRHALAIQKRAATDIAITSHKTNMAVAALFDFEHERAFRYERGMIHSYWDDPRIHNFGNAGWRGLLHAMVVPAFTHLIDRFAYSGVDVRKDIHNDIIPQTAHVVDLCCGVGFSSSSATFAKRLAHVLGVRRFERNVIGVDTSEQMLTVARIRRPEVSFRCGNAESWGEDGCCDVATVMYAMHEMPQGARQRVLSNALRLARQSVLVVDIWPGFEPTPMMLSGEPYVLDYLSHIESDVEATYDADVWRLERVDLVDEHVTMWKLDRI